jgi:hypothetical protein
MMYDHFVVVVVVVVVVLPVSHKLKRFFRAVLWHILCLPVAHKSKWLFVPYVVIHFVPCCGTFCAFQLQKVF